MAFDGEYGLGKDGKDGFRYTKPDLTIADHARDADGQSLHCSLSWPCPYRAQLVSGAGAAGSWAATAATAATATVSADKASHRRMCSQN